MATWQNTSLIMLRTMLNDAGCGNTKYSTERLEDLLITSAFLIKKELNFATAYAVDVEMLTISPNPIEQTDGEDFICFMVLKAACLADEGNFRTAALMQGVSARCGPAAIQTSNYGAFLKELLTVGPCSSYDTLRNEYNFGYSGSRIIRAVMSPFVSNSYDPSRRSGHGLDTINQLRNRGYY